MIERRTTSTATTLATGRLWGRKRLLKIKIGSVCVPASIVRVVTTESANEARLPSIRAITVATAPTFSEVTSASRAPEFWIASPNQCAVRLGGGHANEVPPLKA